MLPSDDLPSLLELHGLLFRALDAMGRAAPEVTYERLREGVEGVLTPVERDSFAANFPRAACTARNANELLAQLRGFVEGFLLGVGEGSVRARELLDVLERQVRAGGASNTDTA